MTTAEVLQSTALLMEMITVKYQIEPSLSLRSPHDFTGLMVKKLFASKCGMAVSKTKMGFYELALTPHNNIRTLILFTEHVR